jgi:hypothetical protein
VRQDPKGTGTCLHRIAVYRQLHRITPGSGVWLRRGIEDGIKPMHIHPSIGPRPPRQTNLPTNGPRVGRQTPNRQQTADSRRHSPPSPRGRNPFVHTRERKAPAELYVCMYIHTVPSSLPSHIPAHPCALGLAASSTCSRSPPRMLGGGSAAKLTADAPDLPYFRWGALLKTDPNPGAR